MIQSIVGGIDPDDDLLPTFTLESVIKSIRHRDLTRDQGTSCSFAMTLATLRSSPSRFSAYSSSSSAQERAVREHLANAHQTNSS